MVIVVKEKEAEDALEHVGFNVVQRMLVTSLGELETAAQKLSYPLVLKNVSLLHKSDGDAVKTNVTEETLLTSFKELRSKNVLVQKQISGVEFLLGIKKDPVFGHVAVCGLGGIFTEVFKDVSFRAIPLTKDDAHSMLSSLRASSIFDARGGKVNKGELVKSILLLNKLVETFPHLLELDINPLIINRDCATVADARMVFEDKK